VVLKLTDRVFLSRSLLPNSADLGVFGFDGARPSFFAGPLLPLFGIIANRPSSESSLPSASGSGVGEVIVFGKAPPENSSQGVGSLFSSAVGVNILWLPLVDPEL
jgi:hypothetical protein